MLSKLGAEDLTLVAVTLSGEFIGPTRKWCFESSARLETGTCQVSQSTVRGVHMQFPSVYCCDFTVIVDTAAHLGGQNEVF